LCKWCSMCFKSLATLLIHREKLHVPFNQLLPLKTNTSVIKTINTIRLWKNIHKEINLVNSSCNKGYP
jgi:hypothetical protein